MATNPASVEDVQARFPRALSDGEQTMADTLLSDAWGDLLVAVTDLADRLDETEEPEEGLTDKVVRVLAQAVKRVLLNPFGRKQESRGIDDAQRSWTLADGLKNGELYFTDDELDSLRSEDGEASDRGKAFSVIPS